MQVANALNNSIRILFNPRVEPFKLFDFLMVKSEEDRYLAQIIEIYDDKFDSSQNVAKLKLFYKITQNNEVMPYDNFTPNKECEIIKVKQEEVEKFINNDKKTFIFGTNTKNSSSLNIQYDFFNNNCVVLADKIEHANSITLNLAKNLSKEKNVIIIDSAGVIEYDEAKKISASKHFKMPLNHITISYVFERLLPDSSLEFQAIGQEILNEIKKFAKKQENGFIPFNAFTRVLMEQYKATPYKELRLLLARIKNCQMDEIFARTKKDVDNLFKTTEKNNITIIDLSSVDFLWQKAYLEYIIADIQQEVYLITRINDENCDVELISKIYNEKKNIKFTPNVSYTYKKLPTLLQYCKNYILMPTLVQRNDFLDANFALSNLISQGCIVFGEDTDNFLYNVRDYELEIQEKRKNYRKIALTLAKHDEEEAEKNLGEKGDYFEQKESQETAHSKKLMEELTNFEKEQSEQLQEKVDKNFDNTINGDDDFDVLEDKNSTKQEAKQESKQEIKEEIIEFEAFEELNKKEESKPQTNSADEFQELDEPEIKEPILEAENKEENKPEIKIEAEEEMVLVETVETTKTTETAIPKIEEADEFISLEKPEELKKDSSLKEDTVIESEENKEASNNEVFGDILEKEETLEIKKEETLKITDVDLIDPSEDIIELPKEPIKEEVVTQEAPKVASNEPEQEEDKEIGFSDEELDFFQIAQESSFDEGPEDGTENIVVDNIEYKTTNEEDHASTKEEVDLSELAEASIASNFEEIINTKNQNSAPTITVDDDTKLNIDVIEKNTKNENLPIFKENLDDKQVQTYDSGDIVLHEKYGKGTVIKIIPYQDSQFLEIEFEESGKKVLDPKRAKLKLAE